jgi:hypothetical protein
MSAARDMALTIKTSMVGSKQVNKEIDSMTRKAVRMQNAFKVESKNSSVVQWANKGKEAMLGFNGAALSSLFLGMQLQKTFGGALKGVFEGYKKAIPEGHKFNMMTNKLSANWEFFKFQLADALAQSPIFQKFIEHTINLIKWLQKLNPEMKAFLTTTLAVVAAFGAWLFMTSTLKLGVAGLIDTSKTLQGLATGFTWGKMSSTVWTVAVIAGIAALAKGVMDFYNSSELGKQAGNDMKSVWKDTMDSVLTPLGEIFRSLGTDINSTAETLIAIGVVTHNFMLIVGGIIDTLIFFGKIIKNIIDLVIDLGLAFYHAGNAAAAFLSGDYASAVRHASNITKNFTGDIEDVASAWNNYVANVDRKALSAQTVPAALEAYRSQLDSNMSDNIRNGKTATDEKANNQIIIIDSIGDAVSSGLIDESVFTELQLARGQ